MGTPSGTIGSSRPAVPADRRIDRDRPPDDLRWGSPDSSSSSTSWTSCRSPSRSTSSRSATGGVAANMCFGWVGSASARSWSAAGGTCGVPVLARAARCRLLPRRISDTPSPPASVCTTDPTGADRLLLPRRHERGPADRARPDRHPGRPAGYVLIGADDPGRHAAAHRGVPAGAVPFIADPSQQLAFSDGDLIRRLIDGAALLFSNEYESAMIEQKTGWSAAEILDRVGVQVTTPWAKGRRPDPAPRREPIELPAWGRYRRPQFTGSATRSGRLLAALSWDVGLKAGRTPGRLRPGGVRRRDGRHPGTPSRRRGFLARVEHSLARAGGRRRRHTSNTGLTA